MNSYLLIAMILLIAALILSAYIAISSNYWLIVFVIDLLACATFAKQGSNRHQQEKINEKFERN